MFNKIDKNYNKVEQVKSLAGSIAHETRNSLSGIKGCCELMKDNLNQLIEYVDLITQSSNQGLSMVEMILANIRDGEIDKSNFVDLSISNVVQKALKQFSYQSPQHQDLISFDLNMQGIRGVKLSLHEVSKLLGHSSLDVTASTYAFLDELKIKL